MAAGCQQFGSLFAGWTLLRALLASFTRSCTSQHLGLACTLLSAPMHTPSGTEGADTFPIGLPDRLLLKHPLSLPHCALHLWRVDASIIIGLCCA